MKASREMSARPRSVYLKLRGKRSAGLSVFRDTVAGILTALFALYLQKPEGLLQTVGWLIISGAGGVLAVEGLRFVLRFVWTVPLEIYEEDQRTIVRLEKELEQRQAEYEAKIKAQADTLDVGVSWGSLHSVHARDEMLLGPYWLVIVKLMLTNRSERPVPINISIEIGLRVDGSSAYGDEVVPTELPKWVVEKLPSEALLGQPQLSNPINLAERQSTPRGFCGIEFTEGLLAMADVHSFNDLMTGRPIWLSVMNNISRQTVRHPLNTPAVRLGAIAGRKSRREQ